MWKHQQFHMELYEVLDLPLPERNLQVSELGVRMVTGDVPLTSFEIATWSEQEKLEGVATLVEHRGIEGPLNVGQGEDGEPKGEGMCWTSVGEEIGGDTTERVGEEGKGIMVSKFCCLGIEVVRNPFLKGNSIL